MVTLGQFKNGLIFNEVRFRTIIMLVWRFCIKVLKVLCVFLLTVQVFVYLILKTRLSESCHIVSCPWIDEAWNSSLKVEMVSFWVQSPRRVGRRSVASIRLGVGVFGYNRKFTGDNRKIVNVRSLICHVGKFIILESTP